MRKPRSALMDSLPRLFAGRLTKEVEREGTDCKRATRSWKIWWVDEFYWLRNKIIHGGKIEPERMTWNLGEHLTIAAMILAVGIKLRIAEKGFYTLTSNEEVCANSIDCFIADGNLSEEKLLDAQLDAGLDRAAERAWENLHREDRPT